MLRLRYSPVNLFEPLQAFPDIYVDLADLAMDPLLSALDQVMDDEKLVLLAWNDYATRRPNCLTTGRPSTPVEVLLRLQAVRRLYGWAYRQVRTQVRGSLALRQFTRVYGHKVPNHATMSDWGRALKPATTRLIHQRVVELAVERQVTTGQQLRTDGTVVETNIHYPTDSSLLADSVRVLGRMLSAGRKLVGAVPGVDKSRFVNRSRSSQRLAREIANCARRAKKGAQTKPQMRKLYKKLLKTTQQSLDHARQALPVLQQHGAEAGQALADSLSHYIPLVQRVIDQAYQRVVLGKQVPAADKLVSWFEPHTAIIRRGKPAPRETEFGRKVWLDEVDGGIISDYRILAGNPPDDQQFTASLCNHQQLFSHPPGTVSTDRGVYSPANEKAARTAGVKQVCMPQPGQRTPQRVTHEQQAWFRLVRRFQAGIEGRISVVKRARQLVRCLDKGEAGFEKWVGWGCIVNNLVAIAQATLKPRRRRRPAASGA
ncbi:MAG: ISNCY family transposase [Chloroflexi bacterium]|nr:ISNCY family transposase [Chloroflexota bacterium]MBU1751219.1 ISNCY family transposase [Chloroflexota bacterium]